MKTIVFNVVICLLIAGSMACEKEQIQISPSDQVTSEQHYITGFDKLDIADPFKVYVSFSDSEESLRIETNAQLHPLVQVEQRQGTLFISLKENTSISGPAVLNVYLKTSGFESLRARGATQVFFQQTWDAGRALIELEGASTLDGAMSAGHLDARLSGASRLSLEGDVAHFEMNALGGSHFEGYGLATRTYTAYLRGACDAQLTVWEKLSVEAEGGSTVYFKGDGVIEKQKLSDSSRIVKVD